jgi:protocatechuate 3,4-dioxygenase beta subunit
MKQATRALVRRTLILFSLGFMKRSLFVLLSLVTAGFVAGQTATPIPRERTFARARTQEGFAICGSCDVPHDLSPNVTLVRPGEPGDKIVISGTIYQADGITPAGNVTIFLYQADRDGYYHRPKEDVFSPRLYGWLQTGRDGHYEIRTIRPQPEVLARDEPAHIHAHVFGPTIPEHFLHEFWFADDPRIKPTEATQLNGLGRFSPIMHLEKNKAGLLSGTRDIKLKPTAPYQYESLP